MYFLNNYSKCKVSRVVFVVDTYSALVYCKYSFHLKIPIIIIYSARLKVSYIKLHKRRCHKLIHILIKNDHVLKIKTDNSFMSLRNDRYISNECDAYVMHKQNIKV